MVSRDDRAPSDDAVFELDRFAWDGPDRLFVAGRFIGLIATTPEDPVLLAHGAEGAHELPVAPDTAAESPDMAGRWSASFAWREAPAAVASADLKFGEHIVELPRPHPEPFGPTVVRVRSARPEPAADTAAEPVGAVALRLQTESLEAQQELADLRAEAERNKTELSRVRQDLEAERAARAEESGRFRSSLDAVRKLADDRLSAERAGVHKLRVALQHAEALTVTDADASERLRGELAAAVRERDEARAELDDARSRAEEFRRRLERAEHQASTGTEMLRTEFDAVLREATALSDGHQQLQSLAEARQAEVDRLNQRLIAIREAFSAAE